VTSRRLGIGLSFFLVTAISFGCGQGSAPSGTTPFDPGNLAGNNGGNNGGGNNGGTQQAVMTLANPGPQLVMEDQLLVVPVQFTGNNVKIDVQGLPPGAHYDAARQTILFRPDFIQGGWVHAVRIAARDGQQTIVQDFPIEIRDSIRPPAPAITSSSDHGSHLRLRLSQVTNDYLDSPGYSGRSFVARVIVPTTATTQNRLPVRVYLHGFGGAPYSGGRTGEFAIYAHDPMNSYWWGYSENLPSGSPTSGRVFNYTQRRVLHLLEWLLDTYPGADPERVYVTGGSMGGAGAKTLGLLYARHFAYAHGTIGQAIPRNHRPARISQLEGLWGPVTANLDDGFGQGVWDRMDLTRALLSDREAKNQFVYTKHGKDDPTIHFGAMVLPSTLTGLSFYEALEQARIGHYAVWDEGGHGSADPVMGSGWWDNSWNRIFDSESYLRRDLPFPAFSRASVNNDPGDGGGNGTRSFSQNRGYAGTVGTIGDTGWNGDIAGALNRHLRWDSSRIVDLPDQLEMPLKVHNGSGSASPRAGYPSKGDQFQGSLPVTTDVTIRRTRWFFPQPGEVVQWTFGSRSGTATADGDGAVTVPSLPLIEAWTTLRLDRP
jgi:poly(3-hydroxybutyrate) depolymerase